MPAANTVAVASSVTESAADRMTDSRAMQADNFMACLKVGWDGLW